MSETIDRAADDLDEALLIASDGSVQVPKETLRQVIRLLSDGTNSGEFFRDIRRALFAPVEQYEVRAPVGTDISEMRDALSDHFGGRRVTYSLNNPKGVHVVNVHDAMQDNVIRVGLDDGKVVILDAP